MAALTSAIPGLPLCASQMKADAEAYKVLERFAMAALPPSLTNFCFLVASLLLPIPTCLPPSQTKLEAEANKARLTQEFLRYSEIQALAANRKIYYGERIPSVFVNSEALGSLSTQPSGDSKE